MSGLNYFLIVIGLMVFVFFILSVTKTKWGINLWPLVCPDCGDKPSSQFRVPANEEQALWGGRTCDRCECEMDKWGRKI